MNFILRDKFLPFHVPEIGREEIDGVTDTLRSGWITTGPKTHAFETEFAKFIGRPHAAAVSSGTAALHLALHAIGLSEGNEVLVPTMTFAATAEVVTYFRAKPVLVDCEPDTLNIDPNLLERAITPRTRAIMPVHFAGHLCDMAAIREIAAARNLKIIEDAAHALPARYNGRFAGTFGDIGCFSLYATKTITTGEGGMIVASNPEYIERVKSLSMHGMGRQSWNRFAAQGNWYYEILSPGYKYNMTDIAAAIGLAQLPKAWQFLEARAGIAAIYNEELADVPEITRPVCRPGIDHAWHMYVIRLELERLRLDREQFVQSLRHFNVGTTVHYMPLHMHPYYRDTFGYQQGDFPVAAAVYERILSLPIYPGMTLEDARYVASAVKNVIRINRR